jgi:hypothetical protein
LHLRGEQARLSSQVEWASWLGKLRGQDWVVYSKPPTAGAEVVLKYLARYTYRVAMSNSRLVHVSQEEVTFTYKDYRQSGKSKEMTLSVGEFARRFLQHILPSGFVRVRHYGLLANRGRAEKLSKCRRLLWQSSMRQQVELASVQPGQQEEQKQRTCPVCGRGRMEVVEVVAPRREADRQRRSDSS